MEENISRDERMWAMFCHMSAFTFFVFPFGHILGPLVIWLIKKDQYKMVDDQGKESLNFQISISLYSVIAALLIIIVIGIPILLGLFILDFILIIIAGVKANDGELYRYPLTIRFIN